MDSKSDFEKLFCPRSVAVIGASATGRTKFGTLFTKANLDSKFDGAIYPVSPSGGELFGLKIYKSIGDIPAPVDLACISVPAHLVHQALEDCLKKGVPWAQILSAGFTEAGEEGKRLEKALADFPKKGLRIVGPNCFGAHCPKCGLTILPGGGFPKKPGGVAFIGQSGGLAVDLGYASPGLGIAWRRMVSFGNGCDVNAAELFDYFAADDETKIIAAYIEGVKDGRQLFEALRRACRVKPVVIWKGGLTESGARAVMSHTGSMGGASEVWRAALRQANAVAVNGQEEMLDTLLAFIHLGEFKGCGVCVAGGGGALGVAASDSAERVGMKLPRFSEKTRTTMESILPPPGTSFNNPADVGNPLVPAPLLEKIIDAAAADEAVDVVMLIQIIHHMTVLAKRQMDMPAGVPLKTLSQHKAVAEACARVAAKHSKPMLQILPPVSTDEDKMEFEALLREARRVSHELGVATYPNIDRALASIARVSNYYRRKEKIMRLNTDEKL